MIFYAFRKVNERLKLLSGLLPIEPRNGLETLAQATEVFSYIDSNFRRWGCDVAGPPTGGTGVRVFEMASDGAFADLFSVGTEFERSVLTQAQICEFVRRYRSWLKSGGNGTFFLFRCGVEFFVAAVFLFADGRIGVRARHFSLQRVFRAAKRHRLVVPAVAEPPTEQS